MLLSCGCRRSTNRNRPAYRGPHDLHHRPATQPRPRQGGAQGEHAVAKIHDVVQARTRRPETSEETPMIRQRIADWCREREIRRLSRKVLESYRAGDIATARLFDSVRCNAI